MIAARLAGLAVLGLVLGGAGCALSSKATPLEIHYFSAEPPATAAGPRAPVAGAPRLRLGSVTAADYLRFRIVHRDAPQSVEPYETLRWAEAPREYVRRALFGSGALLQVVGGTAPTLDVQVTAFEEQSGGEMRPSGHAGRLPLTYQLHDERIVLARGVVTQERVARGTGTQAVGAAIGAAMEAASAELAGRVASRLRGRARRRAASRAAGRVAVTSRSAGPGR